MRYKDFFYLALRLSCSFSACVKSRKLSRKYSLVFIDIRCSTNRPIALGDFAFLSYCCLVRPKIQRRKGEKVEGDGGGLTNAVKMIALYSGGRRQIDCLCAKRVVHGCRGEGVRGMRDGGGLSVAKWKIPGKHQPSLFRTAGNFSDFTLP